MLLLEGVRAPLTGCTCDSDSAAKTSLPTPGPPAAAAATTPTTGCITDAPLTLACK